MTMKIERTLTLERAAAQDDEIEMAISSETPYERFFGIEILGHKANEVDLGRLGDGRHPLLVNHDTDRQVGVITSARLDKDGVLRGKAKLSRSPEGQAIRQDIEDGIRTLVSVGYMVEEMVEQKRGEDGNVVERTLAWAEFEAEQKALLGDDFYRAGPPAARAKGDEPPVYRVTRWTPFEASLVAVPADVTVGVGRAADEAKVQQSQQNEQQVTPTPTPLKEIRIMTDIVTKSPAEMDAERRQALIALGEGYKKYVGDNDVLTAIHQGWSVERFKDFIMQKMESKHTDTRAAHIGMAPKEVQRYSLGRALLASLTGDWTKAGLEREASEACAKMMGRSAEGFYLPYDVFQRDFNVGTGTEAGNLVATDLRGDMYVDALRNAMVLGKMGARYLSGLTSSVDLPRKSSASTIGRLSEIGSASETGPLTAKVTLSPKRQSAYVEVSKQALIQSALALEPMLRDDLLMSAAVELENQIINGTSATAPSILGLRSLTGMGTVTAGANGAAPAWSHFVDLESACANANAEPDRSAGYLINTRTRGKAKQTTKSTYLGFIWDNGDQPVNGYRVGVTNNVPNNLTKGTSTTICSAALFSSDWSMEVIGLFGPPDITVDPYTKADTGQVKITINAFSDAGNRQPATVSKIEDLLSN